MPKRSRSAGFTLIELLIVVAIIGVIAAIAIPNLLNALQRGKQKRTVGDMRTISTALESYMIDNNNVPQQSPSGPVENIAIYLEPTYIKKLPATDGWDRDFIYETRDNFGDSSGRDYQLRSLAKNGEREVVRGAITDFRHDLIFQDGSFLTWPEGTQE